MLYPFSSNSVQLVLEFSVQLIIFDLQSLLICDNRKQISFTLGDFRNISTISKFFLAVAPYNFYYQNGVNYLFLIVKSIELTPGFIHYLKKKFLGGASVELFDL